MFGQHTVFNPGRSFGQYFPHLAKACQILGIPTDWSDAAVGALAKGLRNAQDLSFQFDSYISRPCLLRMLQREPPNSEFGALCLLSFNFLLRVQSECLPIRRATTSEPLPERTPNAFPDLIGVRDTRHDSRLILKLSARKNSRYGAILMRPCFCWGGILAPDSLFPVRAIWPAIRARVLPEELLAPSIHRANLNSALKATLGRIVFGQAGRYTTYAFRLGCLVGVNRAKSTMSEIMRSAGWPSAQFETCMALQEEDAILSLLRTLNKDNESEDEKYDAC